MQTHISDKFVNLILILIIENAAEHMTAVIMIFRHKINLVIEIMLESDVQITVFLLPMIVLMK